VLEAAPETAHPPDTCASWTAFARQITFRHLEAEVAAAADALARMSFYAPREAASALLGAVTAARTHLADAPGRPASPTRDLGWMEGDAIFPWREQGEAFDEYAYLTRAGFRCTAPELRRTPHSPSAPDPLRQRGRPRRTLESHPALRHSLSARPPYRPRSRPGPHGLVPDRARTADTLVFGLGTRPCALPLLRGRAGDVLDPARLRAVALRES